MRTVLALGAALTLFAGGARAEPTRNGFDLGASAVPAEQILRGGPPRDGIPALDDPRVVPADEAPWGADERVIGVELGGEARAYPFSILVWHELVNDTLAGRPLLVSYCPLCGTGIVFDRRIQDETLRFGVSGLLYKSDLLMYDRASESLWSQVEARAVTGPRQGTRLPLVRSRIERWESWRRDHPETTVLAAETGYPRRYGSSPYGDYEHSERLLFPVTLDRRYHPKTPVVGLRASDGRARAYPADEVRRAGGSVEEKWGSGTVLVRWHEDRGVFRVSAPEGLEVIEAFWFAWAAFHPETEVFTAPADR